jgi:hypothetical protein
LLVVNPVWWELFMSPIILQPQFHFSPIGTKNIADYLRTNA